ncbi:MAG: polyprenyl synthetase family protein [Bacteroidales bacterium]|nr:polyprenyl synthetase family protein [Bacteroidales bacterium]
MDLHEIQKHVSTLLSYCQTTREELTHSDIPIINDINKHLMSQNGKQLRPMLTLLSACCCGLPDNTTPPHPVFNAVAAIETLHTSTLIHDDVVDQSDVRRGNPTVNHLWGNKTAVLLGDYYLALVMKTINAIDNKTITQIINHTVIQMSEGELLQQQQSNNYDTDQSVYYQIIRKKTALFMAACCKIGAAFATDRTDLHHEAYLFGENIGIAFQIRDDLLDFKPTQLSGKPQGNDIKEHKCTLPLIFALENDITKDRLLPLLTKNGISDNEISLITQIVEQSDSIQKTEDVMHDYLRKAQQHLLHLPDNKYRDAIFKLTDLLQEI